MLLYDSRKRQSREVRRAVEIATVGEEAEPIFSFDGRKDHLRMGKIDRLLQKTADKLGMSRQQVKKELDERERFISKSEPDFTKFFRSYQEKFYGGC
jgi:hypothetical protein